MNTFHGTGIKFQTLEKLTTNDGEGSHSHCDRRLKVVPLQNDCCCTCWPCKWPSKYEDVGASVDTIFYGRLFETPLTYNLREGFFSVFSFISTK